MEEICRSKNVSSQQVFSIYVASFFVAFIITYDLLSFTIANQKLKNDPFYYSYATKPEAVRRKNTRRH